MTRIIGRLEQVGLGKESVRGTAVAATYWQKALDLKIDTKVKQVINEQSLGRIEDSDGAINVESYGEMQIKGKLQDQNLGLLLLAAFGSVASVAKAGGDSAVYDHTFTVLNSSAHPSLTISHKSANDNVRYALAMLDSLKFECKHDGYPTYEAVFMSKASASATNTAAFIKERDFIPKMLTFKKASAIAGLAGASAVKIRSFNMEIKKNPYIEYNCGSNQPNEIVNQAFEVSGSVTIVHADATYADLQNNETEQAMSFDFLHTDTIGAAANPEFKIILNRVRISNYSREIGMNSIVEESFDFKALYSQDDSAMASAVLTNLVASY